MTLQLQNLTIRPESVQSLYASHLAAGFLVNRRYQRKLVWNIEEKRAFVDSLKQGYPVPLFLFAELQIEKGSVYEIIDGMQRLNAVFSFLEGEFDLDGAYFDLDTIPETKQQADSKLLTQGLPKLPANECRKIVTYQVPLSIARNKTDEEIDEIFRRINSFGKHLSKQELRQAGSTGHFAQLVRKTAARVRGDVSAFERLPLAQMKAISITNKELPYGIDVGKMFWVENKILTPAQVRESRDEELIADIFGYILLSPKPPSNADILDEYFAIREADDRAKFDEIERAVQKHHESALITRFTMVYDEIRGVLQKAKKPFNQLMFQSAGARVPRYFQIVFLSMYDLIVNESMRVTSVDQLAKLLDGIGENHVNISDGGKWSANEREANVDAVKGIIKKAFRKSKETDPAYDSWITEFETILTQSKTENSLYDWKQGLHNLSKPYDYDPGVLQQVAKTLAAMANHGPGATGYVLIGLTDEARTARRIQSEHHVRPQLFRGFWVFGVDHEASLPPYRKGLDSYFQNIQQELKRAPLTAGYLTQILKDIRLFQYFDRHVVLLKVTALDEPCAYGGQYWQRSGPNVDQVGGESLKQLFKRFYAKG